MCVGMCIDISIHMCACMCTDMCMDMCVCMRIDMCLETPVGICVDMCQDVCALDLRTHSYGLFSLGLCMYGLYVSQISERIQLALIDG